ncbi:MAG TPA: GNAT family N-acetyltransferase [Gaiellaceae bacterium]|nr:GNAT family N-acetyltransferase [Gaiellaceae bacterium]
MIELRRVETDADVELYLRLRNEIYPQHPFSAVALAESRAQGWRLDLVASLDGAPVGVGSVGRDWVDPEGPVGFASVRVLRAARGRGVGTALYRALSADAEAHGRSELYVVVAEEDAGTPAYLGKRGYRCVLQMQGVALDLAALPCDTVSQGTGCELRRLEPGLDRAVYEAAREVEAALDVGDGTAMAPLDFDAWRRRQLPAHVRRDLSFAALDGATVAGYAILEQQTEAIGEHAMTGVRPAYRGRGIATALKLAQARAAHAAGLRELRGANVLANAAMRRVNAKLGYRQTSLQTHLRGPLLL